MSKYLDKKGVSHLWQKIKDQIDTENEPLYLAIEELLEMINNSGGAANIQYGETQNEPNNEYISVDTPNAKYVKMSLFTKNTDGSESISNLEIEIAWDDENYYDYCYLDFGTTTGATIEYINGLTLIKDNTGKVLYCKPTNNITYYSFFGTEERQGVVIKVNYKIEH